MKQKKHQATIEEIDLRANKLVITIKPHRKNAIAMFSNTPITITDKAGNTLQGQVVKTMSTPIPIFELHIPNLSKHVFPSYDITVWRMPDGKKQ